MAHPQIPLDHEAAADCTTLFIGGFLDGLMGRQRRTMRELPPWQPGVSEHRAYYHWDGGGLGVLDDQCLRIRDDLAAYRERHPGLPVILCGHSYGGSAAMHIARHLPRQPGLLVLITLDAVSRRQSRDRAPRLDKWFNVYLKNAATLADLVPKIGGRWGHCPDADANLAFDGAQHDASGRLYSHHHPLPLLTDAPAGAAACVRLLVSESLGSRTTGHFNAAT